MQSDILFDNIYIGHSVEDAEKLAQETFFKKSVVEKALEDAEKPKADDKPKSPSDLKFLDDPVLYVKEKLDLFLTIAANDPIQANSTRARRQSKGEAPGRICGEPENHCGELKSIRIYGRPAFRHHGTWHSLSQLPRPVDGVHIDAQRVGPEFLGIARRLHHDGEDGRPALGAGELAVLKVPLGPGDAE